MSETVELMENSRVYQFPGHRLQIVKPRSISRNNGLHYIQDEAGNCAVVGKGWLWIEIDDGGKGWAA